LDYFFFLQHVFHPHLFSSGCGSKFKDANPTNAALVLGIGDGLSA
jgi:hypothetical protein